MRSLSTDAFRRFALELLSAIGLIDARVERTAFDGTVECLAASEESGTEVYVIFRRSYGSLGASQIRELQERMREHDCDGLYVTNGDFTASAQDEVNNADGALRLIGGDELIDLMRRHGVGVTLDPEGRVIAVEDAWFRSLESEYLAREDV